MKRHTIKIGGGVRRARGKAPVLVANITNMCLEWTYDGPPCDGFEIYRSGSSSEFEDWQTMLPNQRSFDTGGDSPADEAGYKYYIVPTRTDDQIWVTAPSNIVQFA